MPKGKIIMKYLVSFFKLIIFTVIITGIQLLIGCSTVNATKDKVEESLELEPRFDPNTYECLNESVKASDMPDVIAIQNLGIKNEVSDLESQDAKIGYTGVIANFNNTSPLSILVKAPAKQEYSWIVPPSTYYYMKVGPGNYSFSVDGGKNWTKKKVAGQYNLVCGQWVAFQIIKGDIPKSFQLPSF